MEWGCKVERTRATLEGHGRRDSERSNTKHDSTKANSLQVLLMRYSNACRHLRRWGSSGRRERVCGRAGFERIVEICGKGKSGERLTVPIGSGSAIES